MPSALPEGAVLLRRFLAKSEPQLTERSRCPCRANLTAMLFICACIASNGVTLSQFCVFVMTTVELRRLVDHLLLTSRRLEINISLIRANSDKETGALRSDIGRLREELAAMNEDNLRLQEEMGRLRDAYGLLLKRFEADAVFDECVYSSVLRADPVRVLCRFNEMDRKALAALVAKERDTHRIHFISDGVRALGNEIVGRVPVVAAAAQPNPKLSAWLQLSEGDKGSNWSGFLKGYYDVC
jgi:hypothetical protein